MGVATSNISPNSARIKQNQLHGGWGEGEGILLRAPPPDLDIIESNVVILLSHDGTLIPMLLVAFLTDILYLQCSASTWEHSSV